MCFLLKIYLLISFYYRKRGGYLNSGSNTAKHFVRIFCFVIVVMFFLPTFAVSCSDEQLTELSMKDMTFGKKIVYENKEMGIQKQVKEVKPHTEGIVLLAVPILIVVISLFLRNQRVLGTIALLSSIANIAIMIMIKNEILKKISNRTGNQFLEDFAEAKIELILKYPYYTILVSSGMIIAFSIVMIFNSSPSQYEDYENGYYDGYVDSYYDENQY